MILEKELKGKDIFIYYIRIQERKRRRDVSVFISENQIGGFYFFGIEKKKEIRIWC